GTASEEIAALHQQLERQDYPDSGPARAAGDYARHAKAARRSARAPDSETVAAAGHCNPDGCRQRPRGLADPVANLVVQVFFADAAPRPIFSISAKFTRRSSSMARLDRMTAVESASPTS